MFEIDDRVEEALLFEAEGEFGSSLWLEHLSIEFKRFKLTSCGWSLVEESSTSGRIDLESCRERNHIEKYASIAWKGNFLKKKRNIFSNNFTVFLELFGDGKTFGFVRFRSMSKENWSFNVKKEPIQFSCFDELERFESGFVGEIVVAGESFGVDDVFTEFEVSLSFELIGASVKSGKEQCWSRFIWDERLLW